MTSTANAADSLSRAYGEAIKNQPAANGRVGFLFAGINLLRTREKDAESAGNSTDRHCL